MSDSEKSLPNSILNNPAYQQVSSNAIIKVIQSKTDIEVLKLLEFFTKSKVKPALFHNGIVYERVVPKLQ